MKSDSANIDYLNDVSKGKELLAVSSIIICGIVRDCGKQLKKNIRVINQLCQICKSYNVVMFENDSVDDTKQILQAWSKNNNNINVILKNSEDKSILQKQAIEGNPFYSVHRIGKMVKCRNEYLNFIYDKGLIADYIIIIDMDVSKIDLFGILNSFGLPISWDVVTANGYSLSPKFRRRYHDAYALVECDKKDIPQTEKIIIDNQSKYGALRKGMLPVRVFSAFGGLSIYKASLFDDIYYELIENSDERVKVRCEHYSLFKQFKEKGYDLFYINPAMEIKYQSISLKLIFRTLKRYLSKK